MNMNTIKYYMVLSSICLLICIFACNKKPKKRNYHGVVLTRNNNAVPNATLNFHIKESNNLSGKIIDKYGYTTITKPDGSYDVDFSLYNRDYVADLEVKSDCSAVFKVGVVKNNMTIVLP